MHKRKNPTSTSHADSEYAATAGSTQHNCIENIATVTNNGTQDVTALEFEFTVSGTSDDAAHENSGWRAIV